MSGSGQKFVGRNRAPRVQIEYDVELYGAEKKVQIPFVMGVMADLSGKSEEPLAPISERKLLEIDVDNFDDRLKASEQLQAESGDASLEAKLKAAGIGDQASSANSVLDRIKAKQG